MSEPSTALDKMRTFLWWWCPHCRLALMWFHPWGPIRDARGLSVMTILVFVPCSRCSCYLYFRRMGYEHAWAGWLPARAS